RMPGRENKTCNDENKKSSSDINHAPVSNLVRIGNLQMIRELSAQLFFLISKTCFNQWENIIASSQCAKEIRFGIREETVFHFAIGGKAETITTFAERLTHRADDSKRT